MPHLPYPTFADLKKIITKYSAIMLFMSYSKNSYLGINFPFLYEFFFMKNASESSKYGFDNILDRELCLKSGLIISSIKSVEFFFFFTVTPHSLKISVILLPK